jgi:hypothetical protein
VAVDDPPDATCQYFDVEVDQQAKTPVEQFEVGEQLGAVNRRESLYGLHFHNQPPLDKEVDAIRAVHVHIFVPKRHLFLLYPREPAERQLVGKARLIARLEDAWTERSVHFDGRADDLPRKHRINLSLPGALRALCASVVNHEPRWITNPRDATRPHASASEITPADTRPTLHAAYR